MLPSIQASERPFLQWVPSGFDALAIGDSRTIAGHFGSPERLTSNGYQFWTEFLTRGRVRFPRAFNFGVSGETSTQILARAATAAAASPPVAIVLAGVNDATGDPTLANVVAITRMLVQAGKIVIVVPELPRISGWTASRASQQMAVYDGLRSISTKNVYIANPWPYIVDYALATGAEISGMYYDNIQHPSNTGAYYIGLAIANIINSLFPDPGVLPVWSIGLYDATYNPGGCLTPNPMVSGSGGSLAGSATGTVATSTTVSRTGSDITVAASKVTDSAGLVWQQIVLAGTPTTNTQRATITQNVTVANLTVGDNIRAVCEMQVDAGAAGVHGPSLEINPTGGSTEAVSSNYDTWARAVGYAPAVAHAGVLTTPPLVVLASIATFPVQVIARAEQSIACSMTFRIRALGARKI